MFSKWFIRKTKSKKKWKVWLPTKQKSTLRVFDSWQECLIYLNTPPIMLPVHKQGMHKEYQQN